MLMMFLLAMVAGQQNGGTTSLIDRNRADRLQPVTPPVPARIGQPAVRVTRGDAAQPIKGIRFVGARAPIKVAAAARGFLGQQASSAILSRLAAALSAAYDGGDVALYTIAIPDQDFAGGVVVVSLTEGRIGKAQIKTDQPGSHPLLRRRLAPLTIEKPLSRATFERQLALVGAIPGLTVKTDFADPAADGVLVLTVTPVQRRTKVSAGFSNRGVALLGDGQLDVRGDIYGAAIDGDQLTAAISSAADLRRYRYGSVGYTAPIGASGLTASGSALYLETRPKNYPLLGRAKQASVALGYPLVRRTHQSVDLSLGADALDSDNAAFGNVVASEHTRAVRASGAMVDSRTRRSVSLSGSLSQGIGGLGTRVGTPFARRGFAKATGAASINQAIGKRLVARLQASGQYSPDVLPAAERFAIGGETLGRAFDTGLLTGDSGGGALAEVALRPLKAARLATSEVYLFGDYGAVRLHDYPGLSRDHYSLASAGAGVRARYREKAELGLEAARVVKDPYAGFDDTWRVSVMWRVSS